MEERLFALEAEVDASLRELPALEGLQQHLLEKAISSIPGKPSPNPRTRSSSSFRPLNSTSGELVKKHEGSIYAPISPHRSTNEEPNATPGRSTEGRKSSGLMLPSSDPATTQREEEADEVASLLDISTTSFRPAISHEKRRTLNAISAVYGHLEGESLKRAEAVAGFEQERNPRRSPSHKERSKADLHGVEEPWLLDGKTASGRELHAARQHPLTLSALVRPHFRKSEECFSDGICMHATEVEGSPQEWRGFSSQPQFQHLTGCTGNAVTADKIAFDGSSSKEAGALQRGVSTPLAEVTGTGHAADRVQEQLEPGVHAAESDFLRLNAASSEGAVGIAVRRQRVLELQAKPRQEVEKTHSKNRQSDEEKPASCRAVVSTEKEKEERCEARSETVAVVQPQLMIASTPTAQLLDAATQSNTEAALLGPRRPGDLTAAAAVAFPQQSELRISDLDVLNANSLLNRQPSQDTVHVQRQHEECNFRKTPDALTSR
ncbi:hypothetical protein Emag_000309 [Eimeria magna]